MPRIVQGLAAPLPIHNVDTDVIMPKRFLVTITRSGLADGVFADLRFYESGEPRQDFVLNRTPEQQVSILIVGDNFGCGSSREHAVWGLKQYGINGIIGTSFAGIFYDNARKNGLALPKVTPDLRDELMRLSQSSDGLNLSINLETRELHYAEQTASFIMDDASRTSLLEDRDDTLDSLQHREAILQYESRLTEKMRVNVAK